MNAAQPTAHKKMTKRCHQECGTTHLFFLSASDRVIKTHLKVHLVKICRYIYHTSVKVSKVVSRTRQFCHYPIYFKAISIFFSY